MADHTIQGAELPLLVLNVVLSDADCRALETFILANRRQAVEADRASRAAAAPVAQAVVGAREQFEAWGRSKRDTNCGGVYLTFSKEPDGRYIQHAAETAWQAWCAALTAPRPEASAAQPAPSQVVSEANPDVAKMVESDADAEYAAYEAYMDEHKTRHRRNVSLEMFCAGWAAATQARAASPALATWPIAGIRVDRGTVVIVAKGNDRAADDAARWMCGELLSIKNGITADSARAAASEPPEAEGVNHG